MCVEKDNLWYKALKWKYGVIDGKIKMDGRMLSAWLRDIGRVESVGVGDNFNWFEEHSSREMGEGEETSFWSDSWVGGPLKRRFERLYLLSTNKEASIAEKRRGTGGTREWDVRWRRELFEWELELLQVLVDEIDTVTFRIGNR
ncbi:putative non-LTR retroelement reverse transcriptase related protein, partial [Trifolium medium]|nr:putative non-LTR retroelement reverse transcriptase related protein [Trifolium medium]